MKEQVTVDNYLYHKKDYDAIDTDSPSALLNKSW